MTGAGQRSYRDIKRCLSSTPIPRKHTYTLNKKGGLDDLTPYKFGILNLCFGGIYKKLKTRRDS
jgi:hypothetical protein